MNTDTFLRFEGGVCDGATVKNTVPGWPPPDCIVAQMDPNKSGILVLPLEDGQIIEMEETMSLYERDPDRTSKLKEGDFPPLVVRGALYRVVE